jgi:hypothetical protein
MAWAVIFWTIVIGIVTYAIFFRSRPPIETTVLPPGWSELGQCTDTTSLDGRKSLSLSDNQVAELTERHDGERPKNSVTQGKWAFDERSKSYTVNFNDEATTYFLLSKDNLATCVLVKGTIDAAQLNESWFSTIDDGSSDDAPPAGEITAH